MQRLWLRELHLRKVDVRLALVARIVADPEQAVVEDQAGVAGVAAGGEGQQLGELAGVWVNPAEARAGVLAVKADGGDEPAVGQEDHCGAADPLAEVLPRPLLVRRRRRA